jgi:hypothetical protein
MLLTRELLIAVGAARSRRRLGDGWQQPRARALVAGDEPVA